MKFIVLSDIKCQVRMSAAVYFKNCMKKAWSKEQAEGDSDALQYRVSDADRLIIRQHIVETVIHLESDQLKRFSSKLLTTFLIPFNQITSGLFEVHGRDRVCRLDTSGCGSGILLFSQQIPSD